VDARTGGDRASISGPTKAEQRLLSPGASMTRVAAGSAEALTAALLQGQVDGAAQAGWAGEPCLLPGQTPITAVLRAPRADDPWQSGRCVCPVCAGAGAGSGAMQSILHDTLHQSPPVEVKPSSGGHSTLSRSSTVSGSSVGARPGSSAGARPAAKPAAPAIRLAAAAAAAAAGGSREASGAGRQSSVGSLRSAGSSQGQRARGGSPPRQQLSYTAALQQLLQQAPPDLLASMLKVGAGQLLGPRHSWGEFVGEVAVADMPCRGCSGVVDAI
jgi:hypothetical protein